MEELPPWILPIAPQEWYLLLRVVPGAKKSECAGVMEGRLRVRIAAPAVENKANKALVAFIAKTLNLRPSNITLEQGDTGRIKKLRISAKTPPNWSCLTP